MNEEKVKQNEIEVNEENKETVETRKSEPQTNNAKTKKRGCYDEYKTKIDWKTKY